MASTLIVYSLCGRSADDSAPPPETTTAKVIQGQTVSPCSSPMTDLFCNTLTTAMMLLNKFQQNRSDYINSRVPLIFNTIPLQTLQTVFTCRRRTSWW